MNKKQCTVEFTDDHHLWIGCTQYISLKRSRELREYDLSKTKELIDKLEEVEKENKALKYLLAHELEKEKEDD